MKCKCRVCGKELKGLFYDYMNMGKCKNCVINPTVLNLEEGDKIYCIRTDLDSKGLLEIDKEYTVDKIYVHSWNTDVYVKEIQGEYFNSVLFDIKELSV